jgi:CO/xanthine dehydrogenase FAD-binding subunit
MSNLYGTLDLATVLPTFQAHASEPQLASALYDTFGDISSKIIRNAPTLAGNWDELPKELKGTLIEDEIFNEDGKLIRKRENNDIQTCSTIYQRRGRSSLCTRNK